MLSNTTLPGAKSCICEPSTYKLSNHIPEQPSRVAIATLEPFTVEPTAGLTMLMHDGTGVGMGLAVGVGLSVGCSVAVGLAVGCAAGVGE